MRTSSGWPRSAGSSGRPGCSCSTRTSCGTCPPPGAPRGQAGGLRHLLAGRAAPGRGHAGATRGCGPPSTSRSPRARACTPRRSSGTCSWPARSTTSSRTSAGSAESPRSCASPGWPGCSTSRSCRTCCRTSPVSSPCACRCRAWSRTSTTDRSPRSARWPGRAAWSSPATACRHRLRQGMGWTSPLPRWGAR